MFRKQPVFSLKDVWRKTQDLVKEKDPDRESQTDTNKHREDVT